MVNPMKNYRKFLFLIYFISISVHATEDYYPRIGVIASKDEIASINYNCSKPKDDRINYRTTECELSYETLKKGKYDFQAKDVEAEYKKNGFPKELCMTFGERNIADMTQAEIDLEISKGDRSLNDFNIDMISKMIPILKVACKDRTLNSLKNFINLMQRVEADTCTVESVILKRTFVELPQQKGQRSLWVNENSASPPCGKKEIIKFVPLKERRWAIQFENIILNKSAKTDEGDSCDQLNGVRNTFDSFSSTWNLPCKHIKLTNRGAWKGPFNPN